MRCAAPKLAKKCFVALRASAWAQHQSCSITLMVATSKLSLDMILDPVGLQRNLPPADRRTM
jgi:hypothetical protein